MRLSRTGLTERALLLYDASDGHAVEFHAIDSHIPVHGAAADFVNHILPGHDFTDDRVFRIPLRHRAGGDEELAASGIRFAGIGSGKFGRAIKTQTGKKLLVNPDSAREPRLNHG